METTYGDRLHKPIAPSIEELHQAIGETFQRGGNVVIPTFALERAQELLYLLRQGREQNRLPPAMQVFLDSPMAITATEIFERHPEAYAPDAAELFRDGGDPFSLPGLHLARETADSAAINRISGGAVIMAGSGMCTGGRVRHHLRHNLWRPQSSVIFVGYAAQGTLARQIIDGAKSVTIFDETIAVRARIYTINGFSAHARLVRTHRLARQDARPTHHPGPWRRGDDARVRRPTRRREGRDPRARRHDRDLRSGADAPLSAIASRDVRGSQPRRRHLVPTAVCPEGSIYGQRCRLTPICLAIASMTGSAVQRPASSNRHSA